ncbi:MAG TPA: hypothetical protein PLK32_06735 [Defluviitoga tunisiensis]|nr:hypothetical protein [Defluviitoga tunisiensis]
MVNDLIDGISVKLNQVFGDGVRIFSESVKQGLKEPCFFIAVLNPTQNPMIGVRYFREHSFDIHYFPSKDGGNQEIQDVASKLFDALEYITLLDGDLVRGTEMHYEVVDGVLHFFVDYNFHVIKHKAPDAYMEELKQTGFVKKG